MSTTITNSSDAEYQPPWLIRLRDEIPEAEARFGFDFDPVRVSKFDRLLAGVANQDRKFEILRMAYNTGLDPNDPMFTFILTALDMREVFSRDTREFFESAIKVADEAKDLLRELRREGIAIEDKIARLESTASEVAQVMEQSVEYSVNAIKTEIDHYIDQQVTIRISDRAKDASEEISKQIIEAVEHASSINEAIKTSFSPVAMAAKKMEKDSIHILGGYKIPRNIGVLLAATAAVALILGIAISGWLANVSGFGLNADTRMNIAAGQTYRKVYPHLQKSSKTDIQAQVDRP